MIPIGTIYRHMESCIAKALSGNVMKTVMLNDFVGTLFAQIWSAELSFLADKMKKIVVIVLIVCLLTLCVVWSAGAALRERIVFETNLIYIQTDQSGTTVSLQNINNEQVTEIDGLPVLIRRYMVKSGDFDSVSANRAGMTTAASGISLKTEPEIATFAGDLGRNEDFYTRELAQLPDDPRAQSGAFVIDRSYDHDRQIITIGIEPLKFDKNTGDLAEYSSIELDFHGSTNLSLELIEASDMTKISHGATGQASLSQTNYTVDYLIVTHTDFFDAFSKLVSWKSAKCLSVEVAAIDDIIATNSGRDDAEKLRNYLISKYNDGVKYVLLGGDETVIPIRYAYHVNTTTLPPLDLMNICDLYYGDVNGNWDADGDGVFGEPAHDQPDIYAELLVGRLPFHTAPQFENYVDKLISYEQNPGSGSYDYLNRALFISADQMRDYQTVGQHTLLAASYPEYVTSDVSDVVEAPTGDAANPATPQAPNAIQTMSEGWGMTTLLIHGVSDGWVLRSNEYNEWPKSFLFTAAGTDGEHGFLPNVESNGKPGVIYSIGCDNAAFDMDSPPFAATNPCVAESFLAKPNGGAVCFIGYSRWGWVASSWKLEQAFIEYIYNQNNNAAEAVRHSKTTFPYYRDLCYGLNYFGDPEMSVWTDAPQDLQFTRSKIKQTGEIALAVEVSDASSTLSDAIVTITKNGAIVGQAVSADDGYVNIAFEFNLTDEFMLTIYKAGYSVDIALLVPEIVLDSEDETGGSLPESFALYQNFPNPFNPVTTVRFDVPTSAHVVVEIYNVLGQLINVLLDNQISAGSHEIEWNGVDFAGSNVSSGVYFARLRSPGYSRAIKMSLLK